MQGCCLWQPEHFPGSSTRSDHINPCGLPVPCPAASRKGNESSLKLLPSLSLVLVGELQAAQGGGPLGSPTSGAAQGSCPQGTAGSRNSAPQTLRVLRGGCLLLAVIPWPHGSGRRVSRKQRAAGRPLGLRPCLCILPHPRFPFGAGIKAHRQGAPGSGRDGSTEPGGVWSGAGCVPGAHCSHQPRLRGQDHPGGSGLWWVWLLISLLSCRCWRLRCRAGC